MLKCPSPPSVPADPSVGLPPTMARPSCGAMYWKTSSACWRASALAVFWLVEGVPHVCASAERNAASERPAAMRSRALIVGLLGDDDPTGAAHRESEAPGGH